MVHVGNCVSKESILLATEMRASAGQEENQSSVQQSTSAGNLRHLTLSESPTGLMQRMMCKLF